MLIPVHRPRIHPRPVVKDPVQQIFEARQEERQQFDKFCSELREKWRKARQNCAEIRSKGEAARAKLRAKRWSREDG